MNCKTFRKLVMTTRPSERSGALAERLAAHGERCAECAHYEAQSESLAKLLDGLRAGSAPADFTRSVMALVQKDPVRAHGSLWNRVFGALRAPAPTFSLRPAIAIVGVAVMVGAFGVFVREEPPASTTQPAPSATTQVAQDGSQAMDDLVYRHRIAETSLQPLPEDEGMRLVSSY
ncbi:hypothetical protein LLH03_15320 [bacterium]|nr:hypothetical protein [bacterium]